MTDTHGKDTCMNSRRLLSFFAVLALSACGAEGTSEVGLERAKKVVLGNGFACALAVDSSVRCWGDNTYGQLGDGTTEGSSLPVQVVGLEGEVADVVAGESHACALLSSGSVKCWGKRQVGAETCSTINTANGPRCWITDNRGNT
jgi:alpha-tubulin suppressor-like RCC1 family protein